MTQGLRNKISVFAYLIFLAVSLNATTITQKFESEESFTQNFTKSTGGDSFLPFTWSSSGGIGSTGAIKIPSGADQIWTTKQKYSVEDNGVYEISALFFTKGIGYGSLGFTTASQVNAGNPANAVGDSDTDGNTGKHGSPVDVSLGIQFHGGAFSWINKMNGDGTDEPRGDGILWGNGDQTYSDKQTTYVTTGSGVIIDTPDQNKWYLFTFKVTDKTGGSFDLEVTVSNVDQNTGQVTSSRSSYSTTVTNSSIKSASDLYVYFSAQQDRMEYIDNFDIEVSDNVTITGEQAGGNTKHALDFNGSDDSVEIGDILDNQLELTFEAWINPDTTLNLAQVVDKDAQFGMQINASGKLQMGIYDGSDWGVLESTNTIKTNEWTHVAMTRDTDGLVTLYINGEAESNTGTFMGTNNSDSPLTIAHNGINDTQSFDGKIDEVRIWNDARTGTEIQENMNKELIGDEENLVVYYPLNEGAGGFVEDKKQSGTKYYGSIQSSPAWTPQNAVLGFDGIDDKVAVSHNDRYNFDATNDSFTISTFIKTTYDGADQKAIIEKYDNTGAYPFVLRLNGTSNTVGTVVFSRFDNSNNTALTSTATVNDGEWHHILATKDATTDKMHLYIDGVQQGTGIEDTTTGTTANSIDLTIGIRGNDIQSFDGEIAEVAIFERSLSTTEIATLYNGTKLRGNEVGLIGYWPLNEGSSSTAYDISAFQNHGTISGSSWKYDDLNRITIYTNEKALKILDIDKNNSRWGYTITGGDDQDKFDISYSGELSFKNISDTTQGSTYTVEITSLGVSKTYTINVVDATLKEPASFTTNSPISSAENTKDISTAIEATGTSISNSAVNFDGTDDYIDVGDFELGGSMTFEFWTNFSNSTRDSRIIDFGNGQDDQNILLFFAADIKGLAFYYDKEIGDNTGIQYISEAFPLDEWTHVAVTIDGTAGQMGTAKIYINGEEKSSGSMKVPETVTRTAQYINNSSWVSAKWAGKLNDFRIWNKALTSTEINDSMFTELNGNEDNLLLYYKFDETNGTSIADSSANGNNGILSGTTNDTTIQTMGNSDLTYSIASGEDASDFTIDSSTGELTFASTPNLEVPADSNTNNIYLINVNVNDGYEDVIKEYAIRVTDVNENPVISSNGGGVTSSKSIAENSTSVTTVAATDVDKYSNNAMSFDGSDDFITISNFPAFGTTFTQEAWIYPTSTSGWKGILGFRGTDGKYSPAIFQNGQKLQAEFWDDSSTIYSTGSTDDVLTLNAWNHIAITYDGSAYKIYVNGTLAKNTAINATPVNQTGLYIGKMVGALVEYPFEGKINDVRIWDDVRTSTEISNKMNSQLNGNEDNLVAYYKLDSISGTSITDSSSGYDGVLSGTTAQVASTTQITSSTTITYSITGGTDETKFSIDSESGDLTFVSAPDYENLTDSDTNNTYVVEVTASDDGIGTLTDVQTITVTVTDVNENPEITSNGGGTTASINVAENSTAVTTIVANDEDSDTVTFSITGGTDETKFSIVESTGVLTFTSTPDYENPTDDGDNNTYEVEVTASDDGTGTLTDVQTITVTVTDANENPEITSNGGGATASINVVENSTAVTTIVASDEDSNTVTFSITGGTDSTSFDIVSSTGVLTFKTAPDYETKFSYVVEVTASDDGTGTLTDVQTITVTVTDVNENPEITSNGGGTTASINVAENSTAVTTIVASDEDSDTITFSISGGADSTSFDIVSSTGVLTFKTAPDYETKSSYVVEITAHDDGTGELTDVQTITVTVTDANDAPTISGTPNTSVAEDSAYSFTPSGNDVDSGDILTYSITNKPSWASFNTSTGALIGTPTNSDVGTTSGIVINVTDSLNANASLTSFDLEVTNVNDTPTSSDFTITTNEDTKYTFVSSKFIFTDSDSNDSLSNIQISSLPSKGKLYNGTSELIINDTISLSDLEAQKLNYVPVQDENGSSYTSFDFKVNDGTVYSSAYTVTIDVDAINDAPTIVTTLSDETKAEDFTTFTKDIEISDIEDDNLTLEANTNSSIITLSEGWSNPLASSAYTGLSQTLTIESISNKFGTATINVNLIDSGSLDDSQTFIVNVPAVLDFPNISNEEIELSEDFGTFDITLTNIDLGGQSSGTITITPNDATIYNIPAPITTNGSDFIIKLSSKDNIYGSTTATITLDNGVDSPISKDININVKAVNDTPTISGVPSSSVKEDTLYSFIPTGNDVDTSDSLKYSITNKPSWASFNENTGELSGTPTNSDVGTTNGIIITVSDTDKLSSSLPTFNITVSNVNNSPTISGTPSSSVNEDSTYSFIPIGDDIDENDSLTYSITNKPSWASFNTTTGELSGTPTNSDVGTTSNIIITVSDNSNANASLSSFDLEVVNVNDTPTISGTPNTSVNEDSAYSFTPIGSDIDIGDTLEYSITNKPSWASFNTITGVLSGTPTNSDVGTTSNIIISVSDSLNDSTSLSTFNLEVVNTNDIPVTSNFAISTNEDTNYTFTLNDFPYSDDDGDNLDHIQISILPLKGKLLNGSIDLSLNDTISKDDLENQKLVYQAIENENAESYSSFAFKVNDGQSYSGIYTASIAVNAVNDTPLIQTNLSDESKTEDFTSFTKDIEISDIDKDNLTLEAKTQSTLINLSNSWTNPIIFANYNGVAQNLTINSVANKFGIANIDIKVTDTQGLTDNKSFKVEIPAVLDFPSISSEEISLKEDFGSYDITLRNIDMGAQSNATITVTPSDDSIYTVTSPIKITNEDNGEKIITLNSKANVYGNTTADIKIDNGVDDPVIKRIIINVTPVNDAPQILGTPSTAANQGVLYSFTPTLIEVDSNDTSTFSIINKPSWASFDTNTGKLSGTPTNTHIGTTDNIIISVKDSNSISSSLSAFSITVSNVNDAPTISGTPNKTVIENDFYSFTPNANDVDIGDTLSFSITNKPSWASFDTSIGKLSGTPNDSDVGITSAIVISVIDNKNALTALEAFDIEVLNDADGDGIPDILDSDDDNDGNPDSTDNDDDNDGIRDDEEGANETPARDSDGDGVPDYLDSDSDNDGVRDFVEGLSDVDNDGIPDYIDADSIGEGDSDNDGIPNSEEGISEIPPRDSDGDGIPDYIDGDSDNDGILDVIEKNIDSDNDGIPDYLDSDSDNDGTPDSSEGTLDTDGDGIPDSVDTDSDNDGIPDTVEGNEDIDNDGIPNSKDTDSDGDGKLDSIEGLEDKDLDGVVNYLDADDSSSSTAIDNGDGTQSLRFNHTNGSGEDYTTSIKTPNGKDVNFVNSSDNTSNITIDEPNSTIKIDENGSLDINIDETNGSHNVKVANPGADIEIDANNNMILTTPLLTNPDGTTCQYNIELKFDGSDMITKHYLNKDSQDEVVTTVIMKIPNSSININEDNEVVHTGEFTNEDSKQTKVTGIVTCSGSVETITDIEGLNATYVAVNSAGSTVIIDTNGDVDTTTILEDSTTQDNKLEGLNFKIDSSTGSISASKALQDKTTDEVIYTEAQNYLAGTKLSTSKSSISEVNVDLTNVRLVTVDIVDSNSNTITSKMEVESSVPLEDITRTSNGETGSVTTEVSLGSSKVEINNKLDGKVEHIITVGSTPTQASSNLEGSTTTVTTTGVSTSYDDSSNSGIKTQVDATSTGEAVHKLELNGVTTQATSNILGANTIITKDENEKPMITTSVETTNTNDELVEINIDANSDGSAVHKIEVSGVVTKATSEIVGAVTTIKNDGEVETSSSLDSTTNANVIAKPDGKAVHEVAGTGFNTKASFELQGAQTVIKSNKEIESSLSQKDEMCQTSSEYTLVNITTDLQGESTTKFVKYNCSDDTLVESQNTIIDDSFSPGNIIDVTQNSGQVSIIIETAVENDIQF